MVDKPATFLLAAALAALAAPHGASSATAPPGAARAERAAGPTSDPEPASCPLCGGNYELHRARLAVIAALPVRAAAWLLSGAR
jgi:hypothetical protein